MVGEAAREVLGSKTKQGSILGYVLKLVEIIREMIPNRILFEA